MARCFRLTDSSGALVGYTDREIPEDRSNADYLADLALGDAYAPPPSGAPLVLSSTRTGSTVKEIRAERAALLARGLRTTEIGYGSKEAREARRCHLSWWNAEKARRDAYRRTRNGQARGALLDALKKAGAAVTFDDATLQIVVRSLDPSVKFRVTVEALD